MGLLHGSILGGSLIIPVGIFAVAPTRAAAENPRGKHAYNALIDTGATMTTITERVVKTLSPTHEGEVFYQGVADRANQNTTNIYEICLSIPMRKITTNIPPGKHIGDAHLESTSAKVHRELTVASCLAGDKGYDMLLGTDVLADYSLLMQYGEFVLGHPDTHTHPAHTGKELA